MPTPTDVAMAVRRFNNRPYPELSGRTPLIVESDISFSATVTKTVFDALWQQLYKEKETAQQKGVTVTLEPPPEGAFRAEVKIRAAGQAVTAAHKNDIKATRARIEKLLHGRVLNFDREVLHLLANKEGREQLDKVRMLLHLPILQWQRICTVMSLHQSLRPLLGGLICLSPAPPPPPMTYDDPTCS